MSDKGREGNEFGAAFGAHFGCALMILALCAPYVVSEFYSGIQGVEKQKTKQLELQLKIEQEKSKRAAQQTKKE